MAVRVAVMAKVVLEGRLGRGERIGLADGYLRQEHAWRIQGITGASVTRTE